MTLSMQRQTPPPLLEIRDIAVWFGGIVALDGVSFTVAPGEIRGMIGPNGAGKTTLFNCISRLYAPNRGQVLFEGRSLLKAPPHRIAAMGIGRTFQNLALFETMTVRENVLVGGHCVSKSGFVNDILRLPWALRQERQLLERVGNIVGFLDLEAVAHAPVSGLPLGTKKRVELARALAMGPKLLLLDEPAGGLNHEEVEVLGDLIRKIRTDLGVTILVVEHHMNLVMGVSDKVVALDFGRKIADGSPLEVQNHDGVIRAYLGTVR